MGFWITEIAVVDGFKNVDTAWTKERGDVASLYVGLLGRAADHIGLYFFAGNEKTGTTLSSIANAIATSSEATQKYGALSNSAYVNEVYKNMTGHTATSTDLTNWVYQLDHGTTRGDATLGIMNSLVAATGADHDTLVNRSTVSETLAVTYQMDDQPNYNSISSVTSAADSVQVALTGVQHFMGWLASNQTTYGFYV
jgi:hypothetical protein